MSSSPEEQRAVKRERRSAWIATKGDKCARCSSTVNLEVDHIDPATKLYEVDGLWMRPNKPELAIELAKCQVLCRPCHRAKTNEELRTAQHGTLTRYQSGCRCEACTLANTTRQRQYWRGKGRPEFKAAVHGSTRMYQKGCRCNACKAAKSSANAKYKK